MYGILSQLGKKMGRPAMKRVMEIIKNDNLNHNDVVSKINKIIDVIIIAALSDSW